MTPPNKLRWTEDQATSSSNVPTEVDSIAQKVWDIITISTLNYKILTLLEISGQKFARVSDDTWEETYLIFKDWEYRDFINGTSEVAVYALSTCGTKVRISRNGKAFHSHTNWDITLNSKYD